VSEGGGAGERYQPYRREVLEAAEKGARSRSGSRSPAQVGPREVGVGVVMAMGVSLLRRRNW
jgi:hypothetical protein